MQPRSSNALYGKKIFHIHMYIILILDTYLDLVGVVYICPGRSGIEPFMLVSAVIKEIRDRTELQLTIH